jgi:hypothetical protein
MYSFLLDQTYVNLLILVVIVVLLMFLWRKLSILEGNFFVLEKRVNLLKKDAREDSIARNIDKADIIMNEIFNNYSPSNACKIGGSGSDLSCDTPCDPFGVFQKNKPNNMRIDEIDENMVQYIAQVNLNDSEAAAEEADADVITFAAPAPADADTADAEAAEAAEAAAAADTEADIDKMVDTIISSSEEYEKKASIESNDYGEHNEADNVSVCSEITFTSEDKKNERTLQKKYSKMSLEKLKELCISNKVNSDGTKNQLITRLIDVCNK